MDALPTKKYEELCEWVTVVTPDFLNVHAN